jgi:orotidine-5'-phosphate decarboxylase
VIARPRSPRARLIAALDTADADRAAALAAALAPECGLLKVGLELFAAEGPAGAARVAAAGAPVFLDLKLHDIPNTVAGAVRAVLPLRPAMLTVHAAGGAARARTGRRSSR